MLELNKVHLMDCREGLKLLPDESVDCCITSPPYWGLRDYGTATWQGGSPECDHLKNDTQMPSKDSWAGTNNKLYHHPFKNICGKCGAKRIDNQIGLESTPEQYVAELVAIFREVKRVLKPQGTLWLNLGDSYAGGKSSAAHAPEPGRENEERGAGRVKTGTERKGNRQTGIGGVVKQKDLVGIPWRVAFALQADGWYLRCDIIWAKPNPMLESVNDRPTKAHEYIFLLAKSQKYYYDSRAIREPAAYDGRNDLMMKGSTKYQENFMPNQSTQTFHQRGHERWQEGSEGEFLRNKRSVWTITTKPFSEAHFATFPPDLIEPMIKAGTSEKGVCPKCGKPWVRILQKETMYDHTTKDEGKSKKRPYASQIGEGKGTHDVRHGVYSISVCNGWSPLCQHKEEPVQSIVLDPFMGAGTTAMVSRMLSRRYIGFDLNNDYVEMADKRLMPHKSQLKLTELDCLRAGERLKAKVEVN